mgnify:CR=1 FL=1
MKFFNHLDLEISDRLSYEEQSKARFIFYYALIGFVSTIILFSYLLSKERNLLQNLFMYACIITNPLLGLTALLAWKAKPFPASVTAIISLAIGAYSSLVLDLPAFLSLLMVLLFSANFISIGNRLLYLTFSMLISSILLKLLIESGVIQILNIGRSGLPDSSIIIILILMFSVFSYALFINVLINSGMKNSEKLIQTSEKLRETLSTKERFVALIAHDLRGPVGSITNFLNGMREGHIPMDEEVIDLLKDTSSKTQHLLENLLDWSMVQDNASPLRKTTFSLSSAIMQEIELLNIAALTKELNLIIDCQDDVQVSADFSMICTSFRNLLSNAIKFSRRGGIIRVTCEKTSSQVKVKVVDQGVGMTPETMGKLFQHKYFNDSQFGTDYEKGRGLGLIITSDFIKANNGKIGVESEIGVGSVFWFSIPLTELINEQR